MLPADRIDCKIDLESMEVKRVNFGSSPLTSGGGVEWGGAHGDFTKKIPQPRKEHHVALWVSLARFNACDCH